MPIIAWAMSASSRSKTGSPKPGGSPSAMIAMPVFVCVGVVGVSRAKAINQLVVIARTRVSVFHQHANRRAGSTARVHAREYAHGITLTTLTDEVRGAGAAPIHVPLQISL